MNDALMPDQTVAKRTLFIEEQIASYIYFLLVYPNRTVEDNTLQRFASKIDEKKKIFRHFFAENFFVFDVVINYNISAELSEST